MKGPAVKQDRGAANTMEARALHALSLSTSACALRSSARMVVVSVHGNVSTLLVISKAVRARWPIFAPNDVRFSHIFSVPSELPKIWLNQKFGRAM